MKTILLLLLLLSSCGTRRQVTDIERNLSTTVSVVDSSGYRDSTLIVKQIFSNEDIHVNVKVIEWSIPDSLGNQFPLKTTHADFTNKKKEIGINTMKQGCELVNVTKVDAKQEEKKKIINNIEKDNRLIPVWFWWILLFVIFISIWVIWNKVKR